MKKIEVMYKKEKGAVKPTQGYEGDFAFDMYASEGRLVPPLTFRSVPVPTNLKTAFDPIEAGMFISLRSGCASKTPLIVSNSPGIVEGTYRNGIGILLRNSFIDSSLVDFVITIQGERMPVSKVPKKVLQEARRFYDEETALLGYAEPTSKEAKAATEAAYRTLVPRGTVYIAKHDRVAQMSFIPKIVAEFKEVGVLPESVRQEKGFGSSGTTLSVPPVETLVENYKEMEAERKAKEKRLKRALEDSAKIGKKTQ